MLFEGEQPDVTGEEAERFYWAYKTKWNDCVRGRISDVSDISRRKDQFTHFKNMSARHFGEREFTSDAQEALHKILPGMAQALQNGQRPQRQHSLQPR